MPRRAAGLGCCRSARPATKGSGWPAGCERRIVKLSSSVHYVEFNITCKSDPVWSFRTKSGMLIRYQRPAYIQPSQYAITVLVRHKRAFDRDDLPRSNKLRCMADSVMPPAEEVTLLKSLSIQSL